MENKTLLVVIGVLVVAAVAGLVLFQGFRAPEEDIAQQVFEITDQEETQVISEGSEVREITVEGNEYSYSPASIRVEEGETIRLIFRNTGSVAHDLVIDELGVSTRLISPGASETVEFTVTEGGTFVYYCSVTNHRSLGMEGELVVE